MTVFGNVLVGLFFALMLGLLAAAVADAWQAFVDSADDDDLDDLEPDEGAEWDRARDRGLDRQNGVI